MTNEVAKAGRMGLSTEEIQEILETNYPKIPKPTPKKKKHSTAVSLYERLRQNKDESRMTAAVAKDLSVIVHEYVFLTQKIAWCQMSLPEAAAEIRSLTRKLVQDDVTGAAVSLETLMSETADIWQRIQLTLFRLLNEDDCRMRSEDICTTGQQKIRRKVVCPVPLRFERDLRCGLDNSTVKFYCFS